MLIRVVDSKTKQEVAQFTAFAINTDDLMDVTTFGAPAQTWMATQFDVTMTVDNFKTPESDPPDGILLNGRRTPEQERDQMVRLVAALVNAVGGAISLTRTEVEEIDLETLSFEDTFDGMILRVEKK